MFYRFCLLLCVLVVCGCDGRVTVTGKVKFSDNSSLDCGAVRFVSDKEVYRGGINADGSYRLGVGGDSKGIAPGHYRVSVENATKVDETAPKVAGNSQVIDLVAKKYHDAETSGISCEVKGSMTFDITVEKP